MVTCQPCVILEPQTASPNLCQITVTEMLATLLCLHCYTFAAPVQAWSVR